MKYFLLFISILLFNNNVFSQFLSNPESVVFDSKNDRYIVSNADIENKNGKLLSIDPISQEISDFIIDGLISPKGLIINKSSIYCTDIQYVKGFDLSTGKVTLNIHIPDAKFLNDITTDGKYLYVSDNVANKIFAIEISSGNIKLLVEDRDLIKPNGLYYSKKTNSLIICSFRANSPIQNYNLDINMLSVLTTTNLNQLDGITMDTKGNYYISSWGDNAIYKFDPLFSEQPIQISNGYFGPADIYYDIENNIIAIPNFKSNIVTLLDMDLNGENVNVNPYDIKIYPNPTSGLFTINFTLDYQSKVLIQVMNKSGKTIHKLEKYYYTSDYQKITIDSKNIGLTKGVFFIKIVINEDIFMKRIVVLD